MVRMVILVTGVTGAGKSTIGRRLAESLGWEFAEGDAFHPETNIDKMRRGRPLTDEDRAPWLDALRAAIVGWVAAGTQTVLACSLLKQRYREIVQAGHRDHLRLVYLKGNPESIERRLADRRGHFAGPDLLVSQFDALEEPTDALTIDADQPPDESIKQIRAAFEL